MRPPISVGTKHKTQNTKPETMTDTIGNVEFDDVRGTIRNTATGEVYQTFNTNHARIIFEAHLDFLSYAKHEARKDYIGDDFERDWGNAPCDPDSLV